MKEAHRFKNKKKTVLANKPESCLKCGKPGYLTSLDDDLSAEYVVCKRHMLWEPQCYKCFSFWPLVKGNQVWECSSECKEVVKQWKEL